MHLPLFLLLIIAHLSCGAIITAAVGKSLLDEPECVQLREFCPPLRDGNDLDTLECVQKFEALDKLSDACKTTIWAHVHALVDDTNVSRLLQPHCAAILASDLCKKVGTQQSGQLLGCLLDHWDQIEAPECKSAMRRLELAAFADFRSVAPFVQRCQDDIEIFACGRLPAKDAKFTQGETLACLQDHVDRLSEGCKHGIFRLSELQGENFRLDWQLFVACSKDSATFCADVPLGDGAIFKCLVKNKNDSKMSKRCQKELVRRDKLIAQDYRVSRGLVKACREDIKLNHCRRGVSDDKNVRLAQILLCLEAAFKNSTKLAPECLTEMSEHRKMLMNDFHLAPEVLEGCSDDINHFCANLESGPKTVHCLMDHVRPKRRSELRISARCERALEFLMKVADVGEDWRVDPVLKDACQSVVDVACRDVVPGDAHVMSCLMEKLGTNYMTERCESALLQIQFFIARDFKLDPQLYRACHEDAVRLCKAKQTWADIDTASTDPERGPLVLPCLHRYAYHSDKAMQLRPKCFQEVKRVMRQRAVAVELIPEVEDQCIEDLALYCYEKTQKGEEMQCLQDHLEKLAPTCHDAVAAFTEEQSAHIELNPVILAVCRGAMQKHCAGLLSTGKDEGEMMDCLIAHKNDPDLRQDLKCRAAVEHFQIVSLKDYHFTHKFKEACRPHVTRYCPKSVNKYDVVSCLSEVMRNDTIAGLRQHIPKECRQQVRAQLFQQRENIDFDPNLKTACFKEIEEHCQGIDHGAGQMLECLQTHHGNLSPTCRHALFAIKKSEMTDGRTDYTLMNTCQDMLKQFCHNAEANKLDCLKIHKDEPTFDQNCRLVVVNRILLANLDYRFNPALQSACNKDIADYCTAIVAKARDNEELNGKVIECLRGKFREGKLHPECERQMTEVLHEQALNYKLNPLLQSVCKSEIETICAPKDDAAAGAHDDERGETEECLKEMFLQNRIITKECKVEVAVLIQEAKADIHVDPILQRACTVDLLKYCSSVQSGNGRLLKCLQVIYADESKALEDDCRTKLQQRMEMFRNAAAVAPAAESLSDLYSQVVTSPSKSYFLVVLLSFVGVVFVFGLLCGRVTRRSLAAKNK